LVNKNGPPLKLVVKRFMKTFFLISHLLLFGNYYAQDTTITRIQFNEHAEIGDLLFGQEDFTGATCHYEQTQKTVDE